MAEPDINFVIDKIRPDLGGNVRHGDISTFSPRLWRCLADRYAIASFLDVGCGEGHAVRFFHRLGILAHGIEGMRQNVDRSVYPIALHDLLSGPYYMPVDLVWSCEVAEHIVPEKVNNFIETLCNGKVVAMTHALPNQWGYHHVNCQPPQYWISLMADRGYYVAPENDVFRAVTRKDGFYNFFQDTGLVFLRG